MEYAVVDFSGRQFKVRSGDVIELDGAGLKDSLTFDKVLLYVSSDGDVKIGKPYLEGFSVSATVVSSGLGQKVRVARFTAKSRHRRVVGFRPKETRVKIEKILVKSATKKASTTDDPKKAK